MYNCVELFAGAGGLGTGFLNAGFNIISANDIWQAAADTYIANHPNVKYIVEDIAKIDGDILLEDTGYAKEDIDVIIGGPPCQGFSTLGKRFIDDPRNRLFKEYIRIVSDIRPKVFVMENVSGILSMQRGKVLENIINSFNEIGYKVQYRLLNAAEYGVPQLRERVIFIGTRLDIQITYPQKKYAIDSNSRLPKAITFAEATSDLPLSESEEITSYISAPQNDFQRIVRENANNRLMNHKPSIHSEKAKKMMEYIPEGSSAWEVNMPEDLKPTSGFGNTYARLDSNIPGMTITRNFACISSSRCIHPFINRGLTAREAARIQSFPDNYIFKGSKTDIEIEIGNSVPPILAKEIGESIIKMLDENTSINDLEKNIIIESRNRSEGWKHAKLSGHINEQSIENKIMNEEEYQYDFLCRIERQNEKIKDITNGGIKEKDVDCILGSGKTKSKTDMKVILENNDKINISIKKSEAGQVYLISISRFISGMEKQYDITIPDNVKRAIELFWGDSDDVEDIINRYGTKPKYEHRKHRLVATTLKAYDIDLYNCLIQWFKDNIEIITDFCFSRGLASSSEEWAKYIWYKNEIGENSIDNIVDIKKICIACKKHADEKIEYGTVGRRDYNSITIWICTMA